MGTVTGKVETVQIKRETKDGKPMRTPLYSLKVDGKWYGCGFDKPDTQEGAVIQFEANDGKYGAEVVKGTIKAGTAKAVQQVQQKADDRQLSIIYQSQHRDAVEAVNFAIDHGFVKLPAKAADQYDVYLGLINDLTKKWTGEAMNPTFEAQEKAMDVSISDEDPEFDN